MEVKEIARQLMCLAGQLASREQHPRVTVQCRCCGFKDDIRPSRAKAVRKTQRGYTCDRCLSFSRNMRYAEIRRKREARDNEN